MGNQTESPKEQVCPECGTACGAGDRFCRQCGAALGVAIDTKPGISGPSSLPFTMQVLILGGGLVVVALLFLLYRQIEGGKKEAGEQTQTTQQQPMQSPHDLTTLPADFTGLVKMGNEQMDAGNYGMATECYRRALEQNPNAYDVRVDFAVSLHSVGMSPRAIEELRTVCQQAPDHPLAFFNLGIIFKETHQIDSAKVYLQQFMSKFPSNPNIPNAQAALQELSS